MTSTKDGIEIMETAKKAGRKVLVNMFLRYDPYCRMIHDLNQSKEYGALKHLAVFRRTPPIWGRLGSDTIAISLMIHELDFITWLSKDAKLLACNVTANSDDSGAVMDCLLSCDPFSVHVQGNSMLALPSPFEAGYHATFENACISYIERSSRDFFESECCIYHNGKKEKITLEREEHCKAVLAAAIKDFLNEKESGLAIENALPGLFLAFELSKH